MAQNPLKERNNMLLRSKAWVSLVYFYGLQLRLAHVFLKTRIIPDYAQSPISYRPPALNPD